jgi:hypothetical protein
MLALLDVNAALPENDWDFWKNVLSSCTDSPTDVLDGYEASYPETVDCYIRKDGVTRFCCEIERNLSGGYSQDEYAENFRKALHLLTKDVLQDFKVALNMYYLEHDPDLEVEYSRQELAA